MPIEEEDRPLNATYIATKRTWLEIVVHSMRRCPHFYNSPTRNRFQSPTSVPPGSHSMPHSYMYTHSKSSRLSAPIQNLLLVTLQGSAPPKCIRPKGSRLQESVSKPRGVRQTPHSSTRMHDCCRSLPHTASAGTAHRNLKYLHSA